MTAKFEIKVEYLNNQGGEIGKHEKKALLSRTSKMGKRKGKSALSVGTAHSSHSPSTTSTLV